MPNPFFQFKQFIVRQDRCAMKVGTDGVLLGAWTDVMNSRRILDVGTGTGLVALMLAQRCDAQIVGVELDSDAANQAQENFKISPWNDRLQALCADFTEFYSEEKFDTIVSNPPYFEQSLLSLNEQRTNARHTQTLNYESLIDKSIDLLTESGTISLVFPTDKLSLLEEIAVKNNLFVSRKCFVKPKPESQPKRILLELSKVEKVCEVSELTIELARHQYTPEYVELTKDYYLKM